MDAVKIVTVPAPAALDGGQLEADLEAAGIAARVVLVGDQLDVTVVEGADQGAVAAVVKAHRPRPPAPSAREQARAAAAAATTVAQLRAAVLAWMDERLAGGAR